MEQETVLPEPRILIFHPDRDSLHNFLQNLTMCGVGDRDAVCTMHEAQNHLIEHHYDLILVTFADNVYADQFVEEIKSLEATSLIPVIAVTSNPQPQHVLRILSKGVERVLVTPLSLKTVQDAMGEALWPERLESARVEIRRARSQLQVGDNHLAELTLHALLAKDPDCAEAYIGLADIHFAKGDAQSAAPLLKEATKAAKKITDRAEQYRLQGLIYHKIGQYFASTGNHEQAIKHIKAALQLNPFHLDALPDLGEVMFKATSSDDILEFFQQLSQQYGPFTPHMDRLASTLSTLNDRYVHLGMADQTGQICIHLKLLDHNNTELHLKVVEQLLAQELAADAVSLLVRITRQIKDTDLIGRLADIYEKASRGGGVSRKSEGDQNPLAGRSPIELLRDASHLRRQCLLLEPYSVKVWMNLIRCLLWLNEQEQVAAMVERFTKSFDQDADQLEGLCSLLLDEQAYDLVAEHIASGLAAYPRDARFHLLQGRLHNAQGAHYEAVSVLKQALRLHADNVQCVIELAATYGKLKSWDEAIELYEKAETMAPKDREIVELLRTALAAKYRG